MIKYIKDNLFSFLTFIYSVIISLFFTALRINYAGISKALGADKNQGFLVMYLPIIICIIIWLVCLYSLYALVSKKKIHTIISLGLCILFTIGIIVIIDQGSIDYLTFILPHFYKSIVVSFMIIIFALILLFPINIKKIYKYGLILIVIIGACFYGYGTKRNYFTYDSVVYAVEDEYQIVFSTNDNSIAWVEIDGNKYYDLYAGSMKSKDLVHKIIVPQEILDKAQSYKICAQKMIYRGPFGGYKGKIISKEHNFVPVNLDDGIDYYVLSDVHESFDGAINAARYKDNFDFYVVLGDITSMVERGSDANATNYLMHSITKGERPVVYARGNHEIKGEYAEDLYKYVGSLNNEYYYTFSLKDIKGIVLDLGEDHDDDWWEYYDTAMFDLYRDKQTEFLKRLIENDYFKDSVHNMVICHIPVQFVNNRLNHEKYKNEWTSLLNEMNVDVFLCGHQHDLTVFEPGLIKPNTKLIYNEAYKGVSGKTYNGYLTDFNFYGFIVARAANNQTDDTQKIGTDEYTGLYISVDLKNNKNEAIYTNALHEIVYMANMFTPNNKIDAVNKTVWDNHTKQ